MSRDSTAEYHQKELIPMIFLEPFYDSTVGFEKMEWRSKMNIFLSGVWE